MSCPESSQLKVREQVRPAIFSRVVKMLLRPVRPICVCATFVETSLLAKSFFVTVSRLSPKAMVSNTAASSTCLMPLVVAALP